MHIIRKGVVFIMFEKAPMTDVRKTYAAEANPTTRLAMVLRMIKARNYNSTLAPQIAQEDSEFVTTVAREMLQTYPYLFVRLLIEVYEVKGLTAAVDVIDDVGFVGTTILPELSRVGRYISSDSNPLQDLYDRAGDDLFVEMIERGVADFRRCYLWTRGTKVPTNFEFLSKLMAHVGHANPHEAANYLAEALQIEHEIALSQTNEWHLRSWTIKLKQIAQIYGGDILCDGLAALRAQLMLENPYADAFNIFFVDFMMHWSHQMPEGDIDHQFVRWLADHPQELSRLKSALDSYDAFRS